MKKAADLAKQDGWFQPDQYTNLANPAAHYLTTAPEIWDQTEGKVTHFIATTGTCGTLTGVSRALRHKGVQIIAACPENGHDIPGIRSRNQLALTEHFHEEEYDMIVEGTNHCAYEWCKFANQKESLCCGPSSGLGLATVMKAVPDEPGNVAVVIFCDQVFKYAENVKKHCPEVFGGVVDDPFMNLVNQLNASMDTIPAEHAKDYIDQHKPIIVDCRPPVQWHEKPHISGAISVPMQKIIDGDVALEKDSKLLVVCNAGGMSAKSTIWLKAMGYDATHMMGGTNKWIELGYPTDPAVGGKYCAGATDMPEDMYKEAIAMLNKFEDTIHADHAKDYIEEHKPVLLDCRPEVQWKEKVHVQGAIHHPITKITKGEVEGLEKDTKYLVVCNSGNMSAKSTLALKAQGFKNVKHMMGGTNRWVELGHPTETA